MLQGLAQFCVALLSSWNKRTFSMAITAWSANVLRRSICFSVKGRTSGRRIVIAPMGRSFSQQRRGKHSAMSVSCWKARPRLREFGFHLPPSHECESSAGRLQRDRWATATDR